MQFLSHEWVKAYGELWNNNQELAKGLKKFNNLIEYRYEDKDLAPVQIDVENGKCIYAGPKVKGREPDFEIWATTQNWENIIAGEQGVRSAMLTKKLGFNGSMITAMKYMSDFQKSIEMMSQIDSKI